MTLPAARVRKFQRFHDAMQTFKREERTTPAGVEADKVADSLKPYIDRHWDEYQTWKEENA